MTAGLSRRALLHGGALVVAFSLLPHGAAAQDGEQAQLPGDLAKSPMLDSWLRIDSDGKITVFTGKAELGQGIKTALIQLAAEELAVSTDAVTLITADTAQTTNEGYTAGSHSMQDSGTAIRHAAAQALALLIAAAAKEWGLPAERLYAEKGEVIARPLIRTFPVEPAHRAGYGELVGDNLLHVRAEPQSALTEPGNYRLIGKELPRVDIPAKISGGAAYVQDLRLPNMLHGRIIPAPSYGARLRGADAGAIEKLPGVVKVVRDGDWLAVVAEREYQAVAAMRALAAAAPWEEKPGLPEPGQLFETLAALPAQTVPVRDDPVEMPPGVPVVEASYRRAYQMHASIGPSCAVAQLEDGLLTVWTHSQGVFPLRAAIAQLTALTPDKVRCIHLEASGCYGHNGADDAAADAAMLAMALPGRPVRVQWMREQEHAWEPYGSAMLTRVRGTLSAEGKIAAWDYTVRSCVHSTRPGPAGNLLAGHLRSAALKPPTPKPLPLPEGGGHRNALPLYSIPNARVIYEFVEQMPLRVSALRGLGAYMNIFSIESFIDELAKTVAADPVDFRLRHLDDSRAREVIETAAGRFGWPGFDRSTGNGRGFAFARYKNLAAYLALAVELAVDRDSGQVRLKRAVAAVDCGEAVNPDGIKNQIEGGILQSASWTLYESVAFNRTRILSRDWGSYPILRFSAVPESVEVHVIDRPGQPFLGVGEAAQGPTAAAIANAIADAAGVRLREIPFTAGKVKAAIGV